MRADLINVQNSTTAGQAGQSQASTDIGKLDFLKLLMTQMKFQDPLNPTDNEAFIQQLTSFANLEQLTNLGSKFDDLLTMTGASNAANAVSLLGNDVRVSGNEISGPSADVFYELPESASRVQVEVRSPTGEVIKVIDGLETSRGLHKVQIKDLKEGSYGVFVVANRADGSEISSELSISERVEGVNFSGNIPMLLMQSGREILASEVVEIRKSSQ
ncbi:MAG: flagellar hook assembly protein FlgD [Bdellovibrionota bacterium]|jgi:flagellar basal-body rod modification protein FlgD